MQKQLLLSIKNGDKAAFEQFYLLCKDHVYAMALRTLKSTYSAEDATQQAFLSAYESRRCIPVSGSPMRWLEQLTLKACRQLLHPGLSPGIEEDDLPEVPEDALSEEPLLPQSVIVLTSNALTLRRIIDELPLEQRQILVLTLYNRLGLSETAEIMACSERTVNARLFFALQYIRIEAEERCTIPPETPEATLPFSAVYAELMRRDRMTQTASQRILSSVMSIIEAKNPT